ncbi:nuclear hormone receptor HR96 isoform X3 [Patella vulgata]|uniref:nuclear hormone receptor HR96 isoform X3 n=1 Tax=Patella vulgata TaxID=6465 RepID=UPI00217FB4BD|nr:nuclear hormone receptor HR96 isoform X3 [Patella vulgata]XP_050398059.1 nuclear hormone receptor HR96 isoform X3 [Patella vulgata]XP_050398060.1 nuclear hormone receptor HR96 isoform X3 [Patella vulgata]XP_050398061.1 nuclear hormone receptor HR96 isoform X3 [Patella vulgata]XP_050398062.1 nuclear hormone receptor HR96 isoform X3 [Patella vulgata]
MDTNTSNFDLNMLDEELDICSTEQGLDDDNVKMDISFEDSNSMESVSHSYRPMDTTSPDNISKSRKNKEDKYCGVCGDRALGYNFDAISCESCKAFFRRNAPKGLDYFKCPYEEKCKMDVSNRRFCKRCRLRKCFEIGMRKEYILTEEEKTRKRMRIEENRVMGQGPRSQLGVKCGQSSLKRREKEVEKFRHQSGDVTSSNNRLRPLDPEEQLAINELLSAYQQSLEISVDNDISRNNPSMTDLVNIAEISVRRVIDMSKKIKSFKALSQTDQISLLKGGSIELLIIRSVITFDREKQHFLDPYDNGKYAMTAEQLKIGEGSGLFDEHMKFVKSLAMDLKADETVLILLLVISLFSPDRPCISDKTYIAKEQDKYALLLQHYLESKYPVSYVRTIYPKLLMKLTDIRNLNEEHSQVLLKVNPEGIQPLMKEVLDLNVNKL